jgi:hypothetical protein
MTDTQRAMSVPVRSFPALLPVLVVATACSSSSSGSGADGGSGTVSDGFVGTWDCTGTSTTTFSQPANTPPSMSNTGSTTVITDDGMGNLTSVRTPDEAGAPCTLHSKLSSDGKSTTLEMGETCTAPNGGTLTYTSGGSTLTNPSTYASMATWTFSGTTTKGAPLVGTGSGMSTCTKKM